MLEYYPEKNKNAAVCNKDESRKYNVEWEKLDKKD